MRFSWLCHMLAPALLAFCAGCKLYATSCKSDRGCLSSAAFAEGLHGSCTRDAECKAGLYCIKRVCEAKGDTATGKKCRLTAECGDADYCGNQRLCKPAGIFERGDKCQTTGNCMHGLVCEAVDLSQLGTVSLNGLAEATGSCTQGGKREQGERCTLVSDCLAGLSCADVGKTGKRCIDPAATDAEPLALPALWTGQACAEVKASDPAVGYFEVPRSGKKPAEFYTLPFPNDVRRKGDHIDLSSHPFPPASFNLPYVQRAAEVADADLDGFSTNPVVFFRFSHPYDFATVACDDAGPCAVRIVDITKTSPDYGNKASIEWKTTKGPLSNYICPHWLALRRPVGTPLRPHTTYAAIITKDIRSESGDYARAPDFETMLAGGAPSDAELKAAYDAYAPLRAFITDKAENADNILNAAVFTTQDPEALLPKLRQQIQADSVPTLSSLTLCNSASTKSPCEDGSGRGKCHAPSSEFIELHGRIKLPIFQQGTPPYLTPSDGGGIQLSSSGAPIIQDHRDVCVAISVPAAAAPATGYPVLVFAHGTGGSFAEQLSTTGFAQVAATASVPAALVAIDLPEHGDRRGASTDSPENLFYNFLNPRAARDNVLQGAADLMSVVRWVKQGGLAASESPNGKAVPFDAAHIALMGHSQGATHSALMASYEPDLQGVVLSGNGGHISTSLMTKTNPLDIAAVLPVALLDQDNRWKLAGGGYNPGLAILQAVFDRADPINYAHRLRRDPTAEAPNGQHAFVTYGLDDTFAPEDTQAAYARAGRLVVVAPVLKDLRLAKVDPPLTENETIGGTPRTVALRQYAPKNGTDGHFVAIEQGQDGRADVERFLDQLLSGKPPMIGN